MTADMVTRVSDETAVSAYCRSNACRQQGECPRICVGMSELEPHAFYDRQDQVP
jgi:hypothetical protein